ncbi:heterokaryon incompatibility protein-domain-containing protein [Cladorrhinum sp. PSN259]|nr:heterokaryon incompatibility protein-domain-containing protein [Cladorrhinum sp. PSN259]
MDAQVTDGCCPKCRGLDDILLDAEQQTVPATGKSIITIGKDLGKTQCAVCQFFFAHSPKYKQKYTLEVRLFDRILLAHNQPDAYTPKRFLAVIRQNKRLRYDYSIQNELIEQGVVIFSPRRDRQPPELSLVHPTVVNWELFRHLIQHCKESHGLCRPNFDREDCLPYINLIDCIDQRLIRGHLGMRNAPSEERRFQELFSPESAPLTVRDAIQAVCNLGMRYLWVDRYCIQQNDKEEQKLMIGHMDEVYEAAEATIVAAYGENDEAGLPGVSVLRLQQPRVQTSSWQFLSSCPPIRSVISSSFWATRGWTYQEGRLSRRCLFLTRHQAYLVCRSTSYSETLHSASNDDWISALLNSSRLSPDLFCSRLPGLVGTLCRDRLVFCQRQLTHAEDILDAFRGILRRSPFVSFWGIPIIPLPAKMDGNIGFALGLLWRRRPNWAFERHLVEEGSSRLPIRRIGFPTWSWTSVIGDLFNDGYGGQSFFGAYLEGLTKEPPLSAANLRFWVMLKGNYLSLNDAISHCGERLLPEGTGSERLLVEGDLVRLRRTSTGAYRVHDCEGLDLTLFAELDIHVDGGSIKPLEDALILVNWNDNQKASQKRFVMMLLEWVEEGVAQRKGLVSDYRTQYSATALSQISTTHRTFVLI